MRRSVVLWKGETVALLSNLMVRIGVDSDGVRRGVNKANRELDKMRSNTLRISRDMGASGADGGAEFASGFTRDAEGRLRDAKGRFAKAGEDAGGGSGDGFIGGFGKKLKNGFSAGGLLKLFKTPFVSMGAGILSLLPLLPPLVSGLVSVVHVALGAAPALLAAGAGALILKTAFTALFAQGTAARKALEPLGGLLTKARDAGSQAAARGIRPLAQALAKVARPEVTRFMVGLGDAANRVQRDFLNWAKSSSGLTTLRQILAPLSALVNQLAPHVSALAIAFARLVGRVMPVTASVGERGLAGAIDWLTQKLNAIKADRVDQSLATIMHAAKTAIAVVRTVVSWISKLVKAYRTYETQFSAVADGLALIAIYFGGPVTAAIAIAGLIIRHFDQIKAAWSGLKKAFSGGGKGGPLGKAFQDLKDSAAIVGPPLKKAFDQIKAAVLPVLKQIGTLIVTDLIPTLAAFIRALAPIAAWLIKILGPYIANTLKNTLTVIKGLLNIISGIIKVFTAVLTGHWSTAWKGIVQIVRGVGQILGAVVRQLCNTVTATWRILSGALSAIWHRIWSTAVSVFKAMGRAIVNAVRDVVGGARNAANAVKSAITGVFSRAGSWLVNAGRAIINGLVSGIKSMIGSLVSTLGGITRMVPHLKGPMAVDLKLLEPNGRAIMAGLNSGFRKGIPGVRKTLKGVTSDIPSYAAPRGVAATGRRSNPPELVIKSGGSRLDDALVEVLRKAVRDKGGDVQKVLGR
jgi:phage-related protein